MASCSKKRKATIDFNGNQQTPVQMIWDASQVQLEMQGLYNLVQSQQILINQLNERLQQLEKKLAGPPIEREILRPLKQNEHVSYIN